MLEMHQSIENKIPFGIISSALSQFWLNWLCHDDFVIYSVPHEKRAHENLVKWILTLNRAKSTLCMICGWVCENKNGIATEITRLHLNDFLSYVFVCISQTLALGKQYKQTNKHSCLTQLHVEYQGSRMFSFRCCAYSALRWSIHSTTFSMIEHLCRCAILCKYVIWKLAVWHVDYAYTCWKELILFIRWKRIHTGVCIFHVEQKIWLRLCTNQTKANQVNHALHINCVKPIWCKWDELQALASGRNG